MMATGIVKTGEGFNRGAGARKATLEHAREEPSVL